MTSNDSSKKPFKDEAFLLAVGKRMQQLMKEKDITHEVFYHDTDINPHRYIVGKHNITLSNFKRICDYLEISPEEFMREIKVMSKDDLKDKLRTELLATIEPANELGVRLNRYKQILEEEDWFEKITSLALSNNSSGFTDLYLNKGVHLTLEYIIAKNSLYHQLFTGTDIVKSCKSKSGIK